MKNYVGVYHSPIGILKVITTNNRLCELEFIDTVDFHFDENGYYREVKIQLDEYFNSTRKSFDLNLVMEGTFFQVKAWEALQTIPIGETISYKEQAKRMGNEKAMRAVGNANRKNKIAIIIPCHRVIGSNGQLVGYAGGIDKKEELIQHELDCVKKWGE